MSLELALPQPAQITHRIIASIGTALKVAASQVKAAVDLIDGGATVPFIARYRKEATGGLDDIQLRELAYQLEYQRELFARRATVLRSIFDQGKLTDALHAAIDAADNKQTLEDLYLPYKPRRRTKGMIAREAGLEPLADALWADPRIVPNDAALTFVLPQKTEAGDDFTTVQAVLDGVRDLLSERWSEDALVLQALREWLWADGLFSSRLIEGKSPDAVDHLKFKDYFDYAEPIGRVPSHRALAVFRGRGLEILDATLRLAEEPLPGQPNVAEGRIANVIGFAHQNRAADDFLRKCVSWTWRVKLKLSIERDLFARLRDAAEATAIEVFANNLRDVLLAAPAGPRVVLGLDPGIRTGVKVAVVDATGKLLETATVYPHEPKRDWHGSLHALGAICAKHGVSLIAIGNGTASRETDQLAGELIAQQAKSSEQSIQKVVVSESGASIYSASEYASRELPDVDVSLRGAVSIARRLQDPLAELVKIEPKSIGVGQYQHDVNATQLAKSLDAVVEDCVNGVGVDVNTASSPLLARVSGLSAGVASAVVRHRDANGPFANRRALLDVTGLGPKTFEQAAGFLRVNAAPNAPGANPLDRSSVHPEAYDLVERMLKHLALPLGAVMGKSDVIKGLNAASFVSERFGLPTVLDILKEIEKPGRDPRPDFKVAKFADGIDSIGQLKPGMVLEGTVSNVAQFGAFIDVGVHQDGLVHVSQLSHKYVTDAREIVKAGDIVRVQVVEVDVPRKRIGLTMKLGVAPMGKPNQDDGRRNPDRSRPRPTTAPAAPAAPRSTAMSDAFAKLVR